MQAAMAPSSHRSVSVSNSQPSSALSAHTNTESGDTQENTTGVANVSIKDRGRQRNGRTPAMLPRCSLCTRPALCLCPLRRPLLCALSAFPCSGAHRPSSRPLSAAPHHTAALDRSMRHRSGGSRARSVLHITGRALLFNAHRHTQLQNSARWGRNAALQRDWRLVRGAIVARRAFLLHRWKEPIPLHRLAPEFIDWPASASAHS